MKSRSYFYPCILVLRGEENAIFSISISISNLVKRGYCFALVSITHYFYLNEMKFNIWFILRERKKKSPLTWVADSVLLFNGRQFFRSEIVIFCISWKHFKIVSHKNPKQNQDCHLNNENSNEPTHFGSGRLHFRYYQFK